MPKPKTVQASSQTNSVDVSGTADFSVAIGGVLNGQIHHINLGNAVTTTSTNVSQQLASQTGDGDSATVQAASQSNTFHATGDAAFHIVIEGNQKGAIHHIDVGSIVAALQTNTAIQFAVQAGKDSLLVQASWQSNTFDASGKATVVLVIEGDHKGAIHHIGVGNTFVAIQANDSLQLAAQGGTGGPDVVQTTTQANLNTATSEVEAALVVPPGHRGAIHHLDAGNTIVAIQTNDSLLLAAQGETSGPDVIQTTTQTNLNTATSEVEAALVVPTGYRGSISHLDAGSTIVAIQTNESLRVSADSSDWQL